MRPLVIFLILLIICMPISYAKVIDIPVVSDSDEIDSLRDSGLGVKKFIYAGNNIVASIEDSDIEYYHQGRMSNRLTTNLSGNLDKEFKSLPFGQKVLNSGVDYPFTGKEEDESGLYYFGARYYDDNLGRFSSVDPAMQGNPYNYVENNPMNMVDPSGMVAEVLGGVAHSVEGAARFDYYSATVRASNSGRTFSVGAYFNRKGLDNLIAQINMMDERFPNDLASADVNSFTTWSGDAADLARPNAIGDLGEYNPETKGITVHDPKRTDIFLHEVGHSLDPNAANRPLWEQEYVANKYVGERMSDAGIKPGGRYAMALKGSRAYEEWHFRNVEFKGRRLPLRHSLKFFGRRTGRALGGILKWGGRAVCVGLICYGGYQIYNQDYGGAASTAASMSPVGGDLIAVGEMHSSMQADSIPQKTINQAMWNSAASGALGF
jgi:RHS repeat-associated protein